MPAATENAQRFPPDAARPAQAEAGFERWQTCLDRLSDRGLAATITKAAAAGDMPGLLRAIFGGSPFLTQCLLQDPGIVRVYAEKGVKDAVATAIESIEAPLESGAPAEEFNRHLRQVRRRVSALVAMADLAGAWPLEEVTGAISRLADSAVDAALRFHFRHQVRRVLGPDEETPPLGGLFVLGMGKLGAGELNYSSDIDLIALFEPEGVPVFDRHDRGQAMVRVVRNMVASLHEHTSDGYVFRVDLRLRPDPGSTPVALSVPAAETYYEGMGQNWERAAMIKARPIAGDLDAGARFLEALTPFVWRRSLDFHAIQDVHSIKRQIHAHKGGGTIAVAGHDIKVGRGGIREVEFFAQTQQLIFGGREPKLREPRTCPALHALAAEGRVDQQTADDLEESYRYLRGIEHRLQMVNDQQTQTLPSDPDDLAAFAIFAGYDDVARFEADIRRHMEQVERHYEDLFEDAPSLATGGNLAFTGADHDPDTLRTLENLGFADPEKVSTIVRTWHRGRYRATRSSRAREILTELVPAIVEAFGQTAEPDRAFARFDEFIGGLPAGVQMFALLHANPALLRLVAEIMGVAPRLADQLSRRPDLFEFVLDPDFAAAMPDRGGLAEEARGIAAGADQLEEALDAIRRWASDRWFQIGIQVLRGRLDSFAAGGAYSNVAEAAIGALLPCVETEFARRHGRVPDASFGVLALGKLGARELTATSDLDLVFVYDAPADSPGSDGDKPLSVSHYYARFAQRLFNALTAPTTEGPLFDIDMRLRPFGEQGPLASSLEAFRTYQKENAWTWEKMAMTRSRYIVGEQRLGDQIGEIIHDMLADARDPDILAADVRKMRARIAEAHPAGPPWQVKHMPGGIVDLEFTVQFLQLRHAAEHADILERETLGAIDALAEAGVLPRETATELTDASRLYHQVLSILRLTTGGDFDPEAAPEGLQEALRAATGRGAIEDIAADLHAASRRIAEIFDQTVPDSDAAQAKGDDT